MKYDAGTIGAFVMGLFWLVVSVISACFGISMIRQGIIWMLEAK